MQLTRNPDSLLHALYRLVRKDPAVPGGGWASYLFVLWLRKAGEKESFAARAGILTSLHPPLDRRARRLARMGATLETSGKPRWTPAQQGLRSAGYLIFAPLFALVIVLALIAAGLSLLVSLAIDMLVLFGLIVVPLHALLRALAS